MMRQDDVAAAARDYRRYSRGAIWFHWTIGLLVILNIVLIIGHEALDWATVGTHKAIGITVLILSLGRLGWRLTHRPPPLPPIPGWQVGLAHTVHWMFYVLLIALPLSGWWMSSAGETLRPLNWFGLFDIPYLPVTRGPGGLGGAAHDFHVTVGLLTIPLILLHVAGALKHHFRDRNSVLARMAPWVRPKNL